jgi:hypothetical protein
VPTSSKSEDVDAVEQALGQLAPLKDHAALCGLTPASLRDLVKRGLGPPLFRRPASHHLIGYLGQTRAWLEHNRGKPVEPYVPTPGRSRKPAPAKVKAKPKAIRRRRAARS